MVLVASESGGDAELQSEGGDRLVRPTDVVACAVSFLWMRGFALRWGAAFGMTIRVWLETQRSGPRRSLHQV